MVATESRVITTQTAQTAQTTQKQQSKERSMGIPGTARTPDGFLTAAGDSQRRGEAKWMDRTLGTLGTLGSSTLLCLMYVLIENTTPRFSHRHLAPYP
jgi:hypothetical protein